MIEEMRVMEGPGQPGLRESVRPYTAASPEWRSMPDSFAVVGSIQDVAVIAGGARIRCRVHLIKLHGPGRWRKMKGVALVRLPSGRLRLAELHWYEAHGIGRVEMKRKRYLR